MDTQVYVGHTTRERAEQIRASMTTRLATGKGMIIRTHKNAFAYDLLDFIDQHLPNDNQRTDR